MPSTKFNQYTFGNLTIAQETTHRAASANERQKFVRRGVVGVISANRVVPLECQQGIKGARSHSQQNNLAVCWHSHDSFILFLNQFALDLHRRRQELVFHGPCIWHDDDPSQLLVPLKLGIDPV